MRNFTSGCATEPPATTSPTATIMSTIPAASRGVSVSPKTVIPKKMAVAGEQPHSKHRQPEQRIHSVGCGSYGSQQIAFGFCIHKLQLRFIGLRYYAKAPYSSAASFALRANSINASGI